MWLKESVKNIICRFRIVENAGICFGVAALDSQMLIQSPFYMQNFIFFRLLSLLYFHLLPLSSLFPISFTLPIAISLPISCLLPHFLLSKDHMKIKLELL